MTWVLVLVGAWVGVAIPTALAIGRAVRTADVIEHTDGAAASPSEQHRMGAPPAAGLVSVSVPRPRRTLADR